MENRQRRTQETFRIVLNFLDKQPMTPEPPLLTKMRKELRASFTRLSDLGMRQYAANLSDAAKDVARLRQRRPSRRSRREAFW